MAEVFREFIGSGDPRLLAALSPAERRDAVLHAHAYLTAEDSTARAWLSPAMAALQEMPTPYSRNDLEWALQVLLDDLPSHTETPFWVPVLIALSLDPADLSGLGDRLSAALAALHTGWEFSTEGMRLLTPLYGRAIARVSGIPGDLLMAVSQARRPSAELETLLTDPQVHEAFWFAAELPKLAPTKAWLREADARLAASPRVKEAVAAMLGAYRAGAGEVWDYIDGLLRGLVWFQSRTPGEESTKLISDLAVVAGSPQRRGGARVVAPKAATAAIEVLGDRPGDAPVRALAVLSLTTRSRTLLPRVQAALERIGRARGWAPGEALELSVDDHGLDASGRRTWSLGDDEAGVVEIIGGKARLRAYRGGEVLRAVPPAWKDALAEARAAVTDLNKALGVERRRVEDLLSQERVWEWDTWVARYLDHPVTGAFARPLIWQASADGTSWVSGLPVPTGDGWTLSDQDAAPGPGRRVRLWHPALAGPAEVARWRDRMVEAGLRQPIKQAFREVYLLTPAEAETRLYSNRFAAHVLHYRQANALMRERGWAANYLGGWSDGYHGEAKKEVAAGQWQAVFYHDWVDGSTWEQAFCTTDQVRFERRDGRGWEAAPLTEVPPLVLSEAMRDVDLFVGVTSIAADDTWRDRGEDRFQAYWSGTAFGELTPRAEIRRDVLARLLPRLTVGKHCELSERFLRVRGKLGAYRIHLGSGNIRMEPDDAYLCIVPNRAPAGRFSLPFDDDVVLSVILSKAIMLAADDRITDETIVSQIRRGRP
ncbi:DUF4132 domain-containing protein [Actinoplanes sp. NPDC051470]|uniref:DUF4132 domain-containing protein n=1 Tax=Actinoplanes sp. NPDC051470 TaxID=3157224 RepID=UPI0034468790